MSFTSAWYLLFIAIVFVLYYALPKKYQWGVLLASSLVFYLIAGFTYFIYLVASILITYFVGLFIDLMNKKQEKEISLKENITKEEKKSIKKVYNTKKSWLLAAGIILNLGILLVVKYIDFICGNVVSLLNLMGVNLSWNELNFVLPLGLSFYTFQSIGYCIDVYRGTIEAEKDLFKYALFISFFPQILQGPIGRYNTLSPQLLQEHKLNYDNVFEGTQRIILGYFKKIAIADFVGIFVNDVFANSANAFGIVGVLGAIGYAIQLFADFSGFMDIALGSAKLLGINLDENFDRPYLSRTIPEYWRRWHISLGAFFRDYVYYPLLRSKLCTKLLKSKHKKLGSIIATSLSLFVTWFLIGLWHGASWTYVFHGIFYGLIIISGLILEPIYKKIKEVLHISNTNKVFNCFQVLRTMTIVCFGYILFRSTSLSNFASYITAMFSGSGINEFVSFKTIFNSEIVNIYIYWAQIIILCVVWGVMNHQFIDSKSLPVDDVRVSIWRKQATLNCIIMIVITIASFILVKSLGGQTGGFIYFDF